MLLRQGLPKAALDNQMNTETVKQLLGIKKSVPLTLAEMGAALSACFENGFMPQPSV